MYIIVRTFTLPPRQLLQHLKEVPNLPWAGGSNSINLSMQTPSDTGKKNNLQTNSYDDRFETIT